jgi:proliferating cell nuclear antigen PCNA
MAANSSRKLFQAKTFDAYYLKILVELLTNNLKTAHFEINEKGIRLCQMDGHRRIFINLNLLAENFRIYKLRTEKLYIGLTLTHLHKILKSIKKKDTLCLYIEENDPGQLFIQVFPKENGRKTTSSITVQSVQNLDLEIPEAPGKPIILTSSEFQKLVKDLGSIKGNVINIEARNFHIAFKCNEAGLLSRKVEFGEQDDDSSSDGEGDSYVRTFENNQLSAITKIAGLDTQMKIFPGDPMLFKSGIGRLGEISIYIKSQEQLKEESEMISPGEQEAGEAGPSGGDAE